MEWTKSNISGAELEQKQQAYIKEALEMAKRSVKTPDNGAVKAQERDAAEQRAVAKAEAERKAAAEKRAAEEKAEAERKAARERAAAEKEAEEKAAAEKKDKEAAVEAEKEAEEVNETEANSDIEAESEELIDPEDFAELMGADDTEKECDECEDRNAEDTVSSESEDGSAEGENQEHCDEEDDELIDTAQLAHTKKSSQSVQKETAPANFNQYINRHNDKAQCNCPNCQRKRAMMQQ